MLPIFFMLLSTGILMPGAHNISPVTGCTGYNPAMLQFIIPPSGGIAPYSYSWQLNGIAIPGETSSSYDPPQLTIAGTYRYNCRITDAAGAVASTVSKVVTIVPDPVVSVAGEGTFCRFESVLLVSTITGGTGNINMQWQLSADNVIFSNIPAATGRLYSPATSSPGVIYYRINIFPAVGSCNDAKSASVMIKVLDFPITSTIFHF